MHYVTYFPLLVVVVILKRKYSYTNITGVAGIHINEWNHCVWVCAEYACVRALPCVAVHLKSLKCNTEC